MKPRTKLHRLLIGLVLVSGFALGVGGVGWLLYSCLSPDSSRNRASAIDCTRTWGRLAPFPGPDQKLAISTEGSMFSRAFRVSFVAPPQDIESWLKQSPGTSETVPTTPEPGIRRFSIKPGEGASFAEVTVDDTEHRVFVYVYWS